MTDPQPHDLLLAIRPWLAELPVGVVVIERNRVSFANRAFLRLAGCAWEDVQDAPLSDVVSWVESADGGALRERSDLEPVSSAHATIRVKGTRPVHVRISRQPLGDSTALLSVVDAGPARALDDARYRDLVEQALLGVFRSSEDGRILMANSALCQMLGYDRVEDLLATNINDIYVDLRERRRLLARYKAEGRTTISGTEVRWKRRNGEAILVRLSGRITSADEGRIFEVMVEDVTLQRRLEATLQQTDRLLALGQLAAGVAHDFNNLLTVIIGHADILAHGAEGPHAEEVRESAAAIEHAVRSAAGLTRQLLAFSRRQELRPERLDINAAIAGTERLIRQLLPDSVNLVIVPSSSGLRVEIDPIQFEQILLNLTTNAVDAMPSGGTLWITVRRAALGLGAFGPHVAVAEGAYVEVSVLDTGQGMDARTKARVFEPFFSTKPEGRGTGLGLATVYGIVKQSGGFIFVDSTPGVGTRFRLYFPEAQQLPNGGGVSLPGPSHEPILLVMIDDQARHETAAGLRRLGHAVVEASTPDEALALAGAHEVQCLVSDFTLPGMDALTLHQRLEQHAGGIKALFLMPDGAPSIDGTRWVLEIPFTIAQLARRVSDLLNEQRL